MTASLDAYRHFFAEEIETAAGLRSAPLVTAFATVPRERFLGPGPWTLRGPDGDLLGSNRQTPDANPKRVYHNVAIAIDPARQLFNGQPGTIGAWIDQLGLAPGARVAHIGAGTGYFTAIIAACVGSTGEVVAYEADEALAARARDNLSAASQWGTLADLATVDVRHGDASRLDGLFDAILVNAGTTHPHESWLAALGPGGRLIVPITFGFGGTPITKGIVALLTRGDDPVRFEARVIGFVAIYAAVGVRDASLNERIGKALQANPMPRLTALRRDPHEPSPACWLHTGTFCLEAAPVMRPVAST